MENYVKGTAQYCENMVTIVFSTVFAFVMSVAVHSMRMLRVVNLIFEWSPLIIGGSESTRRVLSKITGYTGDSRMMGRNLDRRRSAYLECLYKIDISSPTTLAFKQNTPHKSSSAPLRSSPFPGLGV